MTDDHCTQTTATSAKRQARRRRAERRRRWAAPRSRGTRPLDHAAFHLEQFLDKLGKVAGPDDANNAPPYNRLADGRLIVPLLLGLPGLCRRQRCRRAKTCTQPHAPCVLERSDDVTAARWQRLDEDPGFRQQRWRAITHDAPPRATRRPSCSSPPGT